MQGYSCSRIDRGGYVRWHANNSSVICGSVRLNRKIEFLGGIVEFSRNDADVVSRERVFLKESDRERMYFLCRLVVYVKVKLNFIAYVSKLFVHSDSARQIARPDKERFVVALYERGRFYELRIFVNIATDIYVLSVSQVRAEFDVDISNQIVTNIAIYEPASTRKAIR